MSQGLPTRIGIKGPQLTPPQPRAGPPVQLSVDIEKDGQGAATVRVEALANRALISSASVTL